MSQLGPKRPKTKDTRVLEQNEYFPEISKIEHSNMNDILDGDTLSYRYYNTKTKINGHNTEDWLRLVINYKNVFANRNDSESSMGNQVSRPWDDETETVENSKRKLKTFFEIMSKLGLKYWTTCDRYILPRRGINNEDLNDFDEIFDFINDLQLKSGIKMVWLSTTFPISCKIDQSPCNDPILFALYGQRIKKCIEMAHKLNTHGLIINCSSQNRNNRSLICLETPKEFKNLAKMLKMIVEYKEQNGYRGELLLQSSCENEIITNAFLLSFLKVYNFEKHFRLLANNINEVTRIAGCGNSVACIELNDTPELEDVILLVKYILDHDQNHIPWIILNTLGLNLYNYKTVFEDLVAQVDLYGLAIQIVCKMYNEGLIHKSNEVSGQFPNSLRDCEDYVRRNNPPIFKCTQPNDRRHWSIIIDQIKRTI